ncbi:MAG: hypothetical protein ACLP1X_15745 [Polyangiaceae bacterium]
MRSSILDQPLAGSDASRGFVRAHAEGRPHCLGPVAVGFEYYATLGPPSATPPWRQEEQQVFKAIVRYEFDSSEP